MIFSKFLDKDNFIFGIHAGLLLPIPVILILGLILIGMQQFLHLALNIRQIDMVLLSMAVNLILIRYFIVKRKSEQTGRGMVVITIIYIILFFVFLKNITLSVSF